jgi:predicted DNA-binding transcriptional regulator YafY
MARNDRIARLFRVLDLLARSKRGLPLKTIADREGWNLRSLYRDVEALEKAGFPIVHDDQRYRLLDGWTPAAQMGVDQEELLALYLARQQTEGWRGTRLGEALDRLYGKLATPPKGKGTAPLVPEGLGGGFSLAPLAARDYTSYRQTVATLDRAIRERLVVAAVYQSIAGEVTRRRVEPAQLHWDARLETLYLIAWCRLRQDVRVFASHRFRAASVLRETFEPRPDVCSRVALRDAFRVWRADRVVPVRLRFHGRSARLVAERRWHSSQRTHREADGALVFEVEVAGVEEIASFILSFGPECEVLGPDALRERVRDAHARAAFGGDGAAPVVRGLRRAE